MNASTCRQLLALTHECSTAGRHSLIDQSSPALDYPAVGRFCAGCITVYTILLLSHLSADAKKVNLDVRLLSPVVKLKDMYTSFIFLLVSFMYQGVQFEIYRQFSSGIMFVFN